MISKVLDAEEAHGDDRDGDGSVAVMYIVNFVMAHRCELRQV